MSARAHVSWPRHPLTGKQFRVSAASDRELSALLAHVDGLRSKLRLGIVSTEDVDRALRRLVHGAVTLERAGEAYARSGVARNTQRRIASFLRATGAAIAPRELDALDVRALSEWIEQLRRRRLEPSTIRGAWRTLRAIVRYAAEREWIGRVPWGAWRPIVRGQSRRGPREAARDPSEIDRLVVAARALDVEREARGLLGDLEGKILAAGYLGLRQGELAGLAWPDLDDVRELVFLARQGDGEPTKHRAVDILVAPSSFFRAMARLRARLEARGLYDPRGPCFPVRTEDRARAYTSGECLSRRDLRRVVARAGLPEISRWSPHSLRDTFVTLELRARHGDLATTRERSRHRSVASLSRYLRPMRGIPAPAIVPPGDESLPALPAVHKK